MQKNRAIILLIVCLPLLLFAGKYTGDFMYIGAGVRSLGMGGAVVSTADDPSAIFWNPAGISQIRNTEIEVMHAFLYENLAYYDNASICQPLPNEVTIGLNWTRLTIPDIPVFMEDYLIEHPNVAERSSRLDWNLPGVPDSSFTSYDDLFQFCFSKHIRKNIDFGWAFFDIPVDLYFGGNIKYIKREILNNLGNGTGFDLAFLMETKFSELVDVEWLGDVNFGINLQNIGGTTITWDTESQNQDEILFNTKMGISLDQPIDRFHLHLILAYDHDYVYDGEDHYGLEAQYNRLLSFRLGQYGNEYAAGLSINVYDFVLDYAFVTNTLGNTNRIGLRLRF
ncbi:MAG: hypothetical protein K9N06_03330 [Candidatus Cloacimonetes bacterium]|nr:hypothetical protein [Candidatus Cloacimonadota bacterium]